MGVLALLVLLSGVVLASYDSEIPTAVRPAIISTSGESPLTWPTVSSLVRTTNRDDPDTLYKRLLYSNSPETFSTSRRILYNSNSLSSGNSPDHRVVYHHENSTGSTVKLAVVVENTSASTQATLNSPRYGKYVYSNSDPAYAGAQATKLYLSGAYSFSSVTIPANGFRELTIITQSVGNAKVASLLCDIHCSGSMRVYVVEVGATEDPAAFVQSNKNNSSYYLPVSSGTQRGDFTTTDVFFDGTLTPDTKADYQIKAGNGGPDAYATGYDYTLYNGGGSQTLVGNYGILYTFSYYIPTWSSSNRMFIGLNPRGGPSRAAAYGTHDLNTVEDEYIFGSMTALTQCGDGGNYGGSYKYVWWQWVPPLGSFLPFLMLHTSY